MENRNQATAIMTPTTRAGTSNTDSADFINDLFKQLGGIFPAWRSAFKTTAEAGAAKSAWLKALVDNGITTPELIDAGIRGCHRHTQPFLPSVGMFIEWAETGRAGMRDMPPLVEAYNEFVNWISRPKEARNPSAIHPAIWWVYNKAGTFSWGDLNNRTHRKIFSDQYGLAIEKVKRGYEFSTPPPLIAPQRPEKEDPELSQAARTGAISTLANLFTCAHCGGAGASKTLNNLLFCDDDCANAFYERDQVPALDTTEKVLTRLESVNSKESLSGFMSAYQLAVDAHLLDYTVEEGQLIENTLIIKRAAHGDLSEGVAS